jgi:hypothetical protein
MVVIPRKHLEDIWDLTDLRRSLDFDGFQAR